MLSFHTYEYLMVLGLYLCAVHHSNPAPARPAHLLSHYTLTYSATYILRKQTTKCCGYLSNKEK